MNDLDVLTRYSAGELRVLSDLKRLMNERKIPMTPEGYTEALEIRNQDMRQWSRKANEKQGKSTDNWWQDNLTDDVILAAIEDMHAHDPMSATAETVARRVTEGSPYTILYSYQLVNRLLLALERKGLVLTGTAYKKGGRGRPPKYYYLPSQTPR